jgi:hypothetical protein
MSLLARSRSKDPAVLRALIEAALSEGRLSGIAIMGLELSGSRRREVIAALMRLRDYGREEITRVQAANALGRMLAR